MIKPWYGPVKDLHQEVICKYGSHHNIWVGSTRLIEWPEGFDCLGICLDTECPVCSGPPEECDACDGTGIIRGELASEQKME